ncbi:hypothetical protein GJV04_11080 [Enterobacteriaceae bacterium RIT714]|nr:hypothetical protein [Lelliottia sp. CFBP8978]MRS90566.1 hypothetical protein [Enterobacteriaceae bacterium RIT714]
MTHSMTPFKLQVSKGALPTVEIDMDMLDKAGLTLDDFVGPVLSALARCSPHPSCTIYLYMTNSVNFMRHCWSAFLIIDGKEEVLNAFGDAIRYKKESESRFSDEIPASQGTPLYHLQDGTAWVMEDGEWKPIESDEQLIEYDYEEEEEESEEETDAAPATRTNSKSRQRAARNDARVGGIKKTIETLFGLPEGSVALIGPDGRALRADAFIRTLRARWDYND